MLALWQHETLSVGTVAELLRLEAATVSPLIKRLEVLDYVEERRSSHDERIVEVSLTATGAKLRETAEAVPGQMMAKLEMGEADLRDLHSTMTRIIDAVDASRADSADFSGVGRACHRGVLDPVLEEPRTIRAESEARVERFEVGLGIERQQLLPVSGHELADEASCPAAAARLRVRHNATDAAGPRLECGTVGEVRRQHAGVGLRCKTAAHLGAVGVLHGPDMVGIEGMQCLRQRVHAVLVEEDAVLLDDEDLGSQLHDPVEFLDRQLVECLDDEPRSLAHSWPSMSRRETEFRQ